MAARLVGFFVLNMLLTLVVVGKLIGWFGYLSGWLPCWLVGEGVT